MDIHEKVIIKHSIRFTEEDYKLITSVANDVWKSFTVDRIIRNHDEGFCRMVQAVSRVRESALYKWDLTYSDDKLIQALIDLLCSFENRFPEDERVKTVDDMWVQILSVIQRGSEY